MAWERTAQSAIIQARLMSLPAVHVYEELRESAINRQFEVLLRHDESLEEALFARGEPLIRLGLAQYGGATSVVRQIYAEAAAGSANAAFDKGVRIACLSNIELSKAHGMGSPAWLDEQEYKRLSCEGDADEIVVWMSNPTDRSVLSRLYNWHRPFDELPPDRVAALVFASHRNPCINEDRTNEHGPDFIAWDIQKGIYHLLQTAPVNLQWINVLHALLDRLDPGRVHCPNASPAGTLSRWAALSPLGSYEWDAVTGMHFLTATPAGEKTHVVEGPFTQLNLVSEFCCLMAALYGKVLEDKRIRVLGSLDDPDITLRCAYYGNAELTPEQMKAANDKDGNAFMYAALFNDILYLKPGCRAKLEMYLARNLRNLYQRRCEQIHRRRDSFDPKPLSESRPALPQSIVQEKPSDEAQALTNLGWQISRLRSEIKQIAQLAMLGFAILLAVSILLRR